MEVSTDFSLSLFRVSSNGGGMFCTISWRLRPSFPQRHSLLAYFYACPHSPTPYWCFLGFHSKSTCQKIIVSWSASGEPELRQFQPQNFHINFFSWEAVSLKGNLPVALLCRFGAHCFGKCFRLCNSCLWIWLIRIKWFFFFFVRLTMVWIIMSAIASKMHLGRIKLTYIQEITVIPQMRNYSASHWFSKYLSNLVYA